MPVDDLITNMLVGQDQLTPYLAKIMNMGRQVGEMQARGLNVSPSIEKMNKHFNKGSMYLDAFNQGMTESASKLKEMKTRFDINLKI